MLRETDAKELSIVKTEASSGLGKVSLPTNQSPRMPLSLSLSAEKEDDLKLMQSRHRGSTNDRFFETSSVFRWALHLENYVS
jgi:hypothetical protein